MGKDRRQHERFTIRQMIDITFPRENYLQAEGLNLSEGGMMCRTTYPVEPLTRVFLMLSLPTGAAGGEEYLLKTEANVVYVRQEADEYVFGVAFAGLSRQDSEALRGFLDSLKKK